jgi:protein-S-isoprenylcysteine O-methyltransferase Ste14
MRGQNSDGGPWSGIWTAQFNEPYQDVFATFFVPAAAVTNSYPASITVTTPEPNMAGPLGAGLVLVAIVLRRWRKR